MCNEFDCNGVVDEDVANKVDTICDAECRTMKETLIQNFTTTEAAMNEMYDQNINDTSEVIDMLSKNSLALTEIGKFVQQWREEMHDPTALTTKLQKQIDEAQTAGLLDPTVAADLKKNVASAIEINPGAPQNSITSVIDNVNKAIRQSKDVKKEELDTYESGKAALKNYGPTALREIRGMTATDRLSKSADAVGGIFTAVTKFQSGDEVQIVSGCLDLANSVAQFLPPPASLVTSTFSGVFNLFTGGPPDPSNQQVIDGLNNTINRGFAHQKNFLEKKFGEQMNLIRVEFQKLEAVIKDEFELLTDNVRNYIDQNHLRRVKNDALSQLEAVEEKLIFIKRYSNVDVPDEVAHSIDRQIATLSTTRYSALSKTSFEDLCTGILDDDYGVSKETRRKYCATLLYAYLIVEQDRSIVLLQLIAVLEKTVLRESIDGYLEVYHHRKNEVEEFVQKTVLEEEMGCSLFNPQGGAPVLTFTQIQEISIYIESLSMAFNGSINAFQNKQDCSRKYLQT